MLLIDSHSHFDDPRLDACRKQDYLDARNSGVMQQVIPAITKNSWPRVQNICRRYTGLFAAFGLHPYFLKDHQNKHLDDLKIWLSANRAVALGECGLDYFDKNLDRKIQKYFFREQLAIAKECGLPVILHANHATEDVILHLRLSGVSRGVVHSFNGSPEQAKRLIDLGFLLSFGGVITYPKASKLRSLVSRLPLDSLMIETDAPDQPGYRHNGELNKPAYLVDVFESVCALRPEPIEDLASRLNKNAQELFQLPSISNQVG